MILFSAPLVLQWGLLVLNGLLVVACLPLVVKCRVLRPLLVLIMSLALTHFSYYWLFLVSPTLLDSFYTMLFSIVLRYQVLFVGMLMLLLAARQKWTK